MIRGLLSCLLLTRRPGRTATRYTLAYRTRPDHQILELVEGIGIVRFLYVHHGTVAETDLRLVEFREPTAKPAS